MELRQKEFFRLERIERVEETGRGETIRTSGRVGQRILKARTYLILLVGMQSVMDDHGEDSALNIGALGSQKTDRCTTLPD